MSEDIREPAATRRAPSQAESSRAWWYPVGADAVVSLALIGGLTLVPFLSWRNAGLREELSTRSVTIQNFQNLEEMLRRNIELSALEGTQLPEPLAERLQAAVSPDSAEQMPELLIVAYTHTVCLRCLHEGLASLRNDRSWREHRISLHAIVGERSRRDRERALLLREDGIISFPITFVPTDELFGALFSHVGDEFAEEPIYLRLDPDLMIQTAFHAHQRMPALLDEWLETIR